MLTFSSSSHSSSHNEIRYAEFKRMFRRTTMTDVQIFAYINQIDARFQRYEFEQTNAGYEDVSYTGRSLQNQFEIFARRSGLDDEILVKNEYKPLSLSHDTVGSKKRESSTLNTNKNGMSEGEKKNASESSTSGKSTEEAATAAVLSDQILTHAKHLSELWEKEQDIQAHIYRESHGELSWLRRRAQRKGRTEKKRKSKNSRGDVPSQGWMKAAEYAESVPGNSPPMSNTPNIWPGQRFDCLDLNHERVKDETVFQFEKRMCGPHHSGGHEARERPIQVNFEESDDEMDDTHAANDRASMFVMSSADGANDSTYLHISSSDWKAIDPCSILNFRDTSMEDLDQIIRVQKHCCGCVHDINISVYDKPKKNDDTFWPVVACKAPRFVWNFFVHVEYREKTELIISDETSSSLRIFSRGGNKGEKLKLESTLGIGYDTVRFDRPMGVAVDSEGRIVVADSGNNRVQVLDESTREVVMILDGRDLVFENFQQDKQEKYGKEDTKRKNDSSKLIWSGSFRNPSDVCIDDCDNIYIADTGNRCVHCYTRDGKHVNTWGEGYGKSEECFVKPCSVTTFLRVPPGLRSRSVNFALECMYENRLFSLDAYRDACVRLRMCGINTVGTLLDTPRERVRQLGLPMSVERACVDWKIYGLNEAAEQCLSVVDEATSSVHVLTLSHILHKQCFVQSNFVRCEVPKSFLPKEVRKKRFTTTTKQNDSDDGDVVETTLHVIPNRKIYVHQGIVLRDEKDFERAMKYVSQSDDDRKLLQQEQAQATDEDKRKVEEWNATYISKFENARIKLKAYVK